MIRKEPKDGQLARFCVDGKLRIRYKGDWYNKCGELMQRGDDLWHCHAYEPIEMWCDRD
jgi:hypothetical protein